MKITDINGIERECLEVSPDPSYPGYIKITFASRRDPKTTRTEWYPAEQFLTLNPNLKDLASQIPSRPPDTIGTVTKSGDDHLKDATQNWKPNIYAGFTVWISRGMGEGQTRLVMRNSKNVLYVDKPWNSIPDKTSQYVVSTNINVPPAQGNSLPG